MKQLTQSTSRPFAWLIGSALLLAALFIWLIPDGKIWWRDWQPGVLIQRQAMADRDARRLRDLNTIAAALATYARAHHTLPAPKEYGGNDGDDWDVSTKGDFLRFLKGTLDPIPLDPINQAANDPCNDPNSYGYGYSVTNLNTGNPLDRTYIICTQLEETHKATEQRRSLREILNGQSGSATLTTPTPPKTTS